MQPPKEQDVHAENRSAIAQCIKTLHTHLRENGIVQCGTRTATEPAIRVEPINAKALFADADVVSSLQSLAIVVVAVAFLCQLFYGTTQHVHLL